MKPSSRAGCEGRRTLVLGWGNPGRLDDGLGPAFVEAFCDGRDSEVAVESEYQLQIENAERVAHFDRVVFVDADVTGAEPFWLRRLEPSVGPLPYTTHSVSPETILALSRDLFDSEPEAWLLGIRGYEFGDFGEGLSEQATINLDQAVEFVQTAIGSDSFSEVRANNTGVRQDDSRGA